MPRGQAVDGSWNWHVQRYICPCCKRKGLYITTYRGAPLLCMYHKKCPDGFKLRKWYDVDVIALNPDLERIFNRKSANPIP